MKIQCPCGARYAFDITPEMAGRPFTLICQNCQTDLSAVVSPLVQQALAEMAPVAAAPAPVRIHIGSSSPPPPAVPATATLRVGAPPKDPAPVSAAPAAVVQPPCKRHGDVAAVDRCRVCENPICPKCMEQFGYVCSPYCEAQAEARGIELPYCPQQRKHTGARESRAFKLGMAGTAVTLLALIASWAYLEFYASHPHVVFHTLLPQQAHSGTCRLVNPKSALLLENGRLSRYDVSSGKQLWSTSPMASPLNEDLRLVGQGETIWVAFRDRMIRYDWTDGHVMKEVRWGAEPSQVRIIQNEALAFVRLENGEHRSLRLDLNSGEIQTKTVIPASEVASKAGSKSIAAVPPSNNAKARAASAAAARPALPSIAPGLSGPEAAIRAVELQSNTKLDRALRDDFDIGPKKSHPQLFDQSRVEILPSGTDALKFTARLIAFNAALRDTMKAAPKKSALNGAVTVTQTTEIANEILNEMRRDVTGGQTVDDLSAYQVTLRRLGGGAAPEWTGEVEGPPEIYSLPTVDALVSHDRVTIFNHDNAKLWETKLSYPLPPAPRALSDEFRDLNADIDAPIVERGDVIYIFDPGVLSAFDRATGVARWRLPSVEISGLRFDAQGFLYVNTTTKGQEQARYSEQIDLSRKDHALIVKVDPKTGTVLWRAANCGHVVATTGNFLYASETVMGSGSAMIGGKAQLLLYRLNPKSGKVLWEFARGGGALGLDFSQNAIQLLTPTELQVLSYVAF